MKTEGRGFSCETGTLGPDYLVHLLQLPRHEYQVRDRIAEILRSLHEEPVHHLREKDRDVHKPDLVVVQLLHLKSNESFPTPFQQACGQYLCVDDRLVQSAFAQPLILHWAMIFHKINGILQATASQSTLKRDASRFVSKGIAGHRLVLLKANSRHQNEWHATHNERTNACSPPRSGHPPSARGSGCQ